MEQKTRIILLDIANSLIIERQHVPYYQYIREVLSIIIAILFFVIYVIYNHSLSRWAFIFQYICFFETVKMPSRLRETNRKFFSK